MLLFSVEAIAQTLQSPTTTFILLLAIVLVVPPVFERLKLPGLVGLLAAGVLFGKSSLGWLDPADDTMKLFAEIGKIYLMFVAGLEIDLDLFQRTRNRSLSFGALTFCIPFVSGVAVGLLFNFGWLAAVLIGSLLASHTLLGYPIVQRLGVVSDEAVTVTVGATIFTDIAALVVLAICLGINQGDFTAAKLWTLLGSLVIYAIAVLFGLKQLARRFFHTTGKDEGNQFLFVLLSVFLAAIGAQLIGVEGIIGAFLAGLAINSVIGDGPVKEKIEFMGSVLFIPMFFVDMGLLLDLEALGDLLGAVALPVTIVSALLGSKLLATLSTKALFRYSWPQTWTMWSLSIPQVAATLAAALIGYQAEIINVGVFNSVILMMLITSTLGPLITARYAGSLAIEETLEQPAPLSWLPMPGSLDTFTVVVPIYNPKTERWLLALAAIIARYEGGQVIPLAITLAQSQMDSPLLKRALGHARRRLKAVGEIQETFEVPIKPVLRIEYSVPQAICHVSREENANLIVLGLGRGYKFGDRLLNSVHDDVLLSAHCPVVVARLLTSPSDFKKILLPIENPSPQTIRILRFAQVLAAANGGYVSLVHVCSAFSSQTHRARLQKQLSLLVEKLPPADCAIETQVLVEDNLVNAISKAAHDFDLVILRSQRRRTSSGINFGSRTEPLVQRLRKSVILVGEPHPHHRSPLGTGEVKVSVQNR